jgi:hypothetical protein
MEKQAHVSDESEPCDQASSRRREQFAAARARMSGLPIPALIELLSNPDLRTRFLAEMCLRDATGT